MGRKKIDKLEKPLELDYIWGDKENETEGFGTLGIALHSRYYLGLPCYGFVIRQFCAPSVWYYSPFRFHLLEHCWHWH
jgi:HAE1 family hydrophobic/amphiphilic exporter-1